MRWLPFAVVVFGLLVLGGIAASAGLSATTDAECTELGETTPGHGTYESDMYARADANKTDCPIDDGAGMGVPDVVTTVLWSR
jgi:hypothetical protein